MKTLLTLFVLLFSSSVLGEWVEFGTSERGGKYYVDMDSIFKSGYLFFWQMEDYNNVPDNYGDLSSAVLIMGDCKLNRVKTLTYMWYKEPMGKGIPEQEDSANKDWKYPSPETIYFILLNQLCETIK